MSQQIVTNILLEWMNLDADTTLERILWVDIAKNVAIVISIPTAKELPRERILVELQQALEYQECRILTQDPFINFASSDVVTEASRRRMNQAWEAISDLIALGPLGMFDPKQRSAWINQQVQQGRFTKPYLYKLLRRYWEGGQTKYALLPQFFRSGARGQTRLESSAKKRGHPVKPWRLKERLPGINVDESVRERLVKGAKKFYESEKGWSLRKAFDETLKLYFKTGYEITPTGGRVEILPPEGARPSFRQFVYWYKKEKRDVEATKLRVGSREYKLKHRALLGNTTSQAFGPGSLYQIDSTLVDLNLVSSIDRSLIAGRPVLYVVIDTFSRMVVGFSVSFEYASWRSALLALENVTTDKATFCQELEIPGVTNKAWPTASLPAQFLADRGEFEGYNADILVEAFSIHVSTTPPFRADWKPLVERHFRLINDRKIKDIEGAVQKKARGSRDTRLDAIMDLKAFRKTLALDFLDFNNTSIIDDYPLDIDMVQDQITPRPIDLWNWGLVHRSGAQKFFPTDVVRNFLLPRENAVVTPKGLRFKKMYFTADILEKLDWFSRARIRGSESRIVSYDPLSDKGEIYLHASHIDEPELKEAMIGIVGRTGLILCRVLEHRGFERGRPFIELELEAEIKHERNQQGHQESETEHRVWQSMADEVIVEEKVKTVQAQEAQGHISKRKRLKGIRENQSAQKELNRQEYTAEVRLQRDGKTSVQPVAQPSAIPVFHDSVSQKLDAIIKSRAIDALKHEEETKS
jgi:putative transposase